MQSGAGERIAGEVLSWPGVTQSPHRFGGVEFRCRGKELGHVHGDRLCDIPLPKALRGELVASGMAEPHHVLPESGWVSIYLESEQDVANAIEILRRKYRRLMRSEMRTGMGT